MLNKFDMICEYVVHIACFSADGMPSCRVVALFSRMIYSQIERSYLQVIDLCFGLSRIPLS